MTKRTVSVWLVNTSWWSELLYLPALNNHPQALAPDGGFVFATVHDIQANVPPKRKPLWIPASLPGTYCTRPASRP
jgi:hypothetical protein